MKRLVGVGLFLGHFLVDAAVVALPVLGMMGAPETPTVVLDTLHARPPAIVEDVRAMVEGREDIADAIVREANAAGLDPRLITGIMLVENPWLKEDTVNWYGATGLMQITEWLHGGEHPECGEDLKDVDTNVCYGVKILQRKLVASNGDLNRALLYYNGCWGETYQPGCERYPALVHERGDI